MASDAACTESMGRPFPVRHGVGGVPRQRCSSGTSLEWETKLRGLAGRRARVEAELVRITCEETFLRKQQCRLLLGIFATKHGEDPDAVDFNPEVEVAGVPAPESLFVL